jgi:hypothetical protein
VIDKGRTITPGAQDLYLDAASPSRDREMFPSRLVLPFFSNRLSDPPSRELREAAERSNAGIIGFLLQGVDLEAMPRPADERLTEALAPLRTKLDMLIDMLVRLSYRDRELPPVCDIELGRTQIAWRSLRPAQRGDWFRVELYFHPKFREPIVVFAQVSGCVEHSPGEGCRIEADLVRMSEGTVESLARLAFLTQRHQQAQAHVRTTAGRGT